MALRFRDMNEWIGQGGFSQWCTSKWAILNYIQSDVLSSCCLKYDCMSSRVCSSSPIPQTSVVPSASWIKFPTWKSRNSSNRSCLERAKLPHGEFGLLTKSPVFLQQHHQQPALIHSFIHWQSVKHSHTHQSTLFHP